jgi:hypothetical protein
VPGQSAIIIIYTGGSLIILLADCLTYNLIPITGFRARIRAARVENCLIAAEIDFHLGDVRRVPR